MLNIVFFTFSKNVRWALKYRVVQYKFTDVSEELLPPSTGQNGEHSILYRYRKTVLFTKTTVRYAEKNIIKSDTVGKSRICWMLEQWYIQVSLGATEY